MEKVGVEAVVAGLSSFLGDMKKVDSAIQGLIPGTKLLDNAFNFLGDTVSGFANFTLNTLAHALGEMIADAVEFVIQKLGELVEATIEAGAEFQTLELRLSTLNFNAAIESGMEFNEAQAESIRLTKEQLDWLQKLAVATPYDAADIANTYTLARSYGFVDDEARTLTESIVNFASGMGLGNTEIERIIVNFGQMVQQGKVTQREMNDLARGSFVPVNDVLKQMSINTGVAMDAMDEFRKTGESVPAFMEAFIQLVDQRFSGSAQKMARTFQGATANLKDFVKSIGGMNIVKPILDMIGGKIADFIGELTKQERWDALVKAAKKLGDALSVIVMYFLDLMPSAKGTASGIIKAMDKIADWINTNRPKIFEFIQGIRNFIWNKLIPAVGELVKWFIDKFVPAIMSAAKWVGDVLVPFLKNDLYPIFLALIPLAAAIGDVLLAAFGGEPNQSFTDWIHNTLIPGIEGFTQWIITNKDEIALWVERLTLATLQLAFFAAMVGVAISFVTTIAAAFLDWLVVSGEWVKVLLVIATIWAAWQAALSGVLTPLLLIVAAIAGVILWLKLFEFGLRAIIGGVEIFVEFIKRKFTEWKDNVTQTITEMIDAMKRGDWAGVGQAWIDGIKRGLENNWNQIIDLIGALIDNAVEAFKTTFGIKFDITEALGLDRAAYPGYAGATAAPSTTNSNTTNTNNYNLSINSSANHEPIVQDFNMLQSIHGR